MARKKPKFDDSICESCAWYWSGVYAIPHCHKGGKRIYDGECIEFEQKEEPISDAERQARKYNRYEREWN